MKKYQQIYQILKEQILEEKYLVGDFLPSENDLKEHYQVSRDTIRKSLKLLQEEGWQVNNVDVTIIAQRPKLAGYIAAMRTNVAKVLDVAESVVNIKATTTEKLGFTGRGEGIAAEAVASIVKM